MKHTLIVPAAADRASEAGQLPHIFRTNSHGYMYCIDAIRGLALDHYDAIYFAVLAKHEQAFCISELLNLQFRRLGLNNAQVIVLPEPTSCQAETVQQVIDRMGIEGSIFIKDADTAFRCEFPEGNGVTVYPLESLTRVNPQNKSYVAVDDMGCVTNIIEKRVIGHLISVGGYAFEDAADFCRYYARLRHQQGVYISHIIFAMLLDRHVFRSIDAEDFTDFELHSGL